MRNQPTKTEVLFTEHQTCHDWSWFTQPHVVSDLYRLLSSAEHKSWKNVGNQNVFVHKMEVNCNQNGDNS